MEIHKKLGIMVHACNLTIARMKKENPELGTSLYSDNVQCPKTATTTQPKDFHGKGWAKDGVQLQPPGDARLPLHTAEGDPAHSMWAPGLWGLARPGHLSWQSKQPLGYCKFVLVLLGISLVSGLTMFHLFTDNVSLLQSEYTSLTWFSNWAVEFSTPKKLL